MKWNLHKGFTLIELLVVISIIALLSSVTIATFSSTRLKAKEAFIKDSLSNIKNQIEILGFDGGTYINICIDPKIVQMVNAMKSKQLKVGCKSSSDGSFGNLWGISTIITSNPEKMYSVSSAGIVTWDNSYNPDPSMNQDSAKNYCKGLGGVVPSQPEFEALYIANGSNPGFANDYYWGNETSYDGIYGILTDMSYGGKASTNKVGARLVRCAR